MSTLLLNGQEIEFEPGQTILQVAKAHGVHIPTLCHLQDADHKEVCRICVVEIKGSDRLLPACATPAVKGMEIQTDSSRVREARKIIIEMLVATGQHTCFAWDRPREGWTGAHVRAANRPWHQIMCPADGDCRLQELVREYGVDTTDLVPQDFEFPLDDEHPLMVRDFSRCILCGRCVAACNQVQVNLAIPYPYGRREEKPLPQGWFPLADYDQCVHCGECVQACPVGALFEKRAFGLARAGETNKVLTTCAYCGVGCQMWLHVKDGRVVKVTGVENAVPNRGRLCVKGRFGYDFIHSPDRLTVPLIKENGTFREASWDEALDHVAGRFAQILRAHGPRSLAGLSSARVTNEENYLMQKLVRTGFKSNNIDHCARLCHASTVAGLAASFGSGAMTNSIAEMEDADAFIVIGSNTTEAHPVLSTFVKRAVIHNGAELVVIDPRRIPLVAHAAVWLRQRPGTDIAVINGLMHVIIRENLADEPFIAERCENYDALQKVVASYTPERVEALSGIPAEDLIRAARIYGRAGKAMILYAMGITQHSCGTDNVKSLGNLAMLTGNVGRLSTGVNPLRGQNNVQGACDMGALPNVFPGYQVVTDGGIRSKFETFWKAPLDAEVGLALTEMLPAAAEGRIKGLFILGENPVVSDPDSHHVSDALKNLGFLVVQDIFLTETGRLADVVLPAACFAEKDGTFTNTERRVQRVRKAVEPPGQARADWRILTDLANRMGLGWRYDSPESIFEEIAALTPSYGGISYKRLERESLQWPCPSADHPGTLFLHKDRFTRGKGVFFPVEHQDPFELPDDAYPMILTTGRLLYQYHTRTMTGRCEGVNALAPLAEVELNPSDATRLQLVHGDRARLTTRRGSITVHVQVTERVKAGVVFMPFHYAEAAANILTVPALDPVAKIPEFKVCAVRVEKES